MLSNFVSIFIGTVNLREIGKASWLIPIKEVLGDGNTYRMYKSLLYYRGLTPSKENQAAIPERIVKLEEDRGFKEQGVYRKRFRYFCDGVLLGTSDWVETNLKNLRKKKLYVRRKNAISNGTIHEFCLR